MITAAKAAAINTKTFFIFKIICHITIVEIKRGKRLLLATRARDLPRIRKPIFILQKILHIIDVKEKR